MVSGVFLCWKQRAGLHSHLGRVMEGWKGGRRCKERVQCESFYFDLSQPSPLLNYSLVWFRGSVKQGARSGSEMSSGSGETECIILR